MKVSGRIADGQGDLGYATVLIYSAGDSTKIGGTQADANGRFVFSDFPSPGDYFMLVSYVGYTQRRLDFSLEAETEETDLGRIVLGTDLSELDEVEISEEKNRMTMDIDKRVYNVEKDISSVGGTALDIMKNLPGVEVDADEEVYIRNNAARIFIDGRPTNLDLDQIPSDDIDRIEIITNPSVKYDAGSSAGILNIILKKNTRGGVHGMATLGAGTNDRYNGMLNLNSRSGPWNFSLSYNFNTSSNPVNTYSNQTEFQNGEAIRSFDQNTDARNERTFHFGRFNADYNLSDNKMIGLRTHAMYGVFATNETQDFEERDGNENLLESGEFINNRSFDFYRVRGQLLYEHEYGRDHKLTTDINYNYGQSGRSGHMKTLIDDSGSPSELQKIGGGSESHNLTYQLDYENKVSENRKWEWGLRSDLKRSRYINDFFNYDHDREEYEKDSLLSNSNLIDEMVNAAYVNYSWKQGKWGYQTGVRFEQSFYRGTLLDSDEDPFSYRYPSDNMRDMARSFFPGLFLTYSLNEKRDFQLNFTRKIGRPSFYRLMPFVMFQDRRNYREGNPELTPEFSNNMEFNYQYIFDKGQWISAVYGQLVEDPMTRIIEPSQDEPGTNVSTYVNGDFNYVYGWENTLNLQLWKKTEMMFNTNLNYSDISSAVGTDVASNRGWNFSTKSTISYKFPANFTGQVSGTYRAPRIMPQGRSLPFYFMDLSLQKTINKTWTFSLQLSDVFNTKFWGQRVETDILERENFRRRNIRYLRLSVSYRFGKNDFGQRRRDRKEEKGKDRRSTDDDEGGEIGF